MRLSLRAVLICLVALVGLGALISAPAAQEKTKVDYKAGWCEDDGVSLVIEGETTVTRCAKNFKDTSWKLFAATGNKVRGTSVYPVGFVCQVNGYPKQQDCIDTPRYDEGSWAFFIAGPGSTKWQYALTGASTHFSECGSAEAWLWVPGTESPETSMPSVKPVTRKCQ
ncbi:MAG: hypothetical protein ORN27_06860 [Rhodoluna sp.]|nr:hypothetical protein [Rhodoluna sp.]